MTPEEREERLAELRARRRSERWSALLRPFVTLASIVISVSLLMYMIKSCQEKNPGARELLRPPIQRAPTPPPGPAK